MHPAQALDLKADLMVNTSNRNWQERAKLQMEMDLLDLYDMDEREVVMRKPVGSRLAKRIRQSTEDMIDRLHDVVRDAHCYYVAPQMTDLVAWASVGLDETDSFRFDEVPTEKGFAYFENPIHITDIRGKTILVNAIVWFRVNMIAPDKSKRSGFAVASFNDQVATPDDIARELLALGGYSTAKHGRWGLTGFMTIMDGQQIGPSELSVAEDSWKAEELLADGVQPHEFTNLSRILHAYWMMLNQTVTSVSESEIPRAYSKRARRAEIPDRVTIVTLRRVSGSSHGESSVDWQYRWICRGHWRWQHVSQHHELAEPDGEGGWRARVWVRAHVRGPEDKPLHITEKVYSLVR